MSKKKSTHIESKQDKTILDSVLWFAKNYFPQKKKRLSYEEFFPNNFVSNAINKIKKLAFDPSKVINGDLSNKKVVLMFGDWALPYLKFLKRIKLP